MDKTFLFVPEMDNSSPLPCSLFSHVRPPLQVLVLHVLRWRSLMMEGWKFDLKSQFNRKSVSPNLLKTANAIMNHIRFQGESLSNQYSILKSITNELDRGNRFYNTALNAQTLSLKPKRHTHFWDNSKTRSFSALSGNTG